MSEYNPYKEIEVFKTKIIDSTLIIGTILGLSAYSLTLFPLRLAERDIDFFTDFVSYSILLSIYLFRKKISVEIKTIVVIIILQGFVITDVILWGYYSMNKIVLVIIPFYALLIFDLKKSIIIYSISISTYLVVGFFHIFGWVDAPHILDESTTKIIPWIQSALILSVASLVIVIFTKRYNTEVAVLIDSLRNKNKDLAEHEKKLEVEKAFTNQILESLPGVFLVYKKNKENYELVLWNKNSEVVFNHQGQVIKGMGPLAGIHKDFHDNFSQTIKNLVLGEKARMEVKIWNPILKDNSPWFYLEASPVMVNNEEYFIGTGVNISEQKKVEELFRKEKNFSDKLLDLIPGMFYLYEKVGDEFFLTKWNKNHETETGYTAEELKGMNPLDFVYDDHRDNAAKIVTQINEFDATTMEAPLQKKDGIGDYWYYVSKKMVDGDKEFIIGIGTEIADRKVMERELEHRNLNLKDMLNDMQVRNNKLAEYAFINSHLLRAPLVRILGLAELVSKEVILSEHQELMENFKTSAEELDAIVSKINDTLDQRRDLKREDILYELNQLNEKQKKKRK